MTSEGSGIRRAHADAADLRRAAETLFDELQADRAAVVLLFVPPTLSRDAVADALQDRFARVPVVGCSTAGEIGPLGSGEQGIVGVSLPSKHFAVAIERIDGLADFAFADGAQIAARLVDVLETRGRKPAPDSTFTLLLVDGLSAREEDIAGAVAASLPGIPFCGGSAGDGQRYGSTGVLSGGQFTSDSAVVMLVHTDLPFRVFKSQHFTASERKLVVTAADWASRTVFELDGLPAARGYARAVGIPMDALGAGAYAAHPLIVKIGGETYVRSVQKRNDDDSLSFFCAVEEGVVMSVATHNDMVESVRDTFDEVRREVGQPEVVLGFDCLLRRIEAGQIHATDAMDQLYRKFNVIGFGSYGEQFHGMHVNQTLTGVAIGAPRREAA